MENLQISWQEFHKDCFDLCHKLPKKFTAIVTITRGGLLPAGVIANIIGIRYIDTISIHSYDDAKQKDDLTVVKHFNDTILKEINQEDILVIDDIADTGKTFKFVRQFLPKACYVAPYIKPSGKHLTDFYAKEFSKEIWIQFPWDNHVI